MKSRVTLAVLTLAGAIGLSACGGSHSPPAPVPPAAAGTATPSATTDAKGAAFHLTTGASDGERHASVSDAGHVTVSGGRISSVELSTAAGRRISGASAADRRAWAPGAALDYGTAYHLTVHATDDAGQVRTETVGFTTLAKKERLIGTFTPEDGSTVGVGMPVSVTFNKPVTDKKAVEAAVKVTDDSGQAVVGHWFGNQRLDLRPQEYWKANTHVTLALRLDGVAAGANAFGVQDKTIHFTVGRSQVSTVDVRTDTMRVVRDGKLIRTVAITSGAPGRTTYNGQMVISQKLIETEMDGATVGYAGQYDIPDVPHAMRLTDSGTFMHGNYWAPDSVFGHSDVSHGCVGLNDVQGGGDPGQQAAWMYDHSIVGDVVVVENSHDRTVAPDNGLNGWNMNWQQWTAGSALG